MTVFCAFGHALPKDEAVWALSDIDATELQRFAAIWRAKFAKTKSQESLGEASQTGALRGG